MTQPSTFSLGSSDAGVVTIDPRTLVTTKMLVTANSGGGKSYLLRKVLERVGTTAQTFVLDLEGEFVTLREKLDLVIVGPGGEIPTDVRSAGLLVRRLMEKNISAVIDMSELRAQPRRQFVREFCETLVGLPKSLWRPLFVCLDEAHQFAPEKGQGEAESLSAVRDLCTLGRKRGFCTILATQRISTLDKSCAAECNNKFLGRMTLKNDLDRAAFELGTTSAEAQKMLRDRAAGEFYGFGPAVSPAGVSLLKVDRVETTHPKAGQGNTLTPPKPSKAITSVVGELADLPKQAEAEIKDMAAAKAKIAELTKQLAAKPAPAAPAAPIVREVEKPVISDAQLARLEKVHTRAGERVASTGDRLQAVVNPLMELLKAEQADIGQLLAAVRAVRATPPAVAVASRRPTAPAAPVARGTAPSVIGDSAVSPAQKRILDALAWWEVIGQPTPERGAAAVMAGYTVNGHFNNLCGALRTAGMIDYPGGGRLQLTDGGRAVAARPSAPGTLADVHAAWKAKLDNAQWRLIEPVIRSHPVTVEKEDLAAAAGYTVNGHFNNLLGSLRSLGVIHKRSPIAATSLLFPDGLA